MKRRDKVRRYIAGVEDEVWNRFKQKYKGHISERLQKLIEMDLGGKLPEGTGVLTSYKKEKDLDDR